MDAVESKKKRLELVKELNRTLLEISEINKEIRDMKNKNGELESKMNIEKQNNMIFLNELEQLKKQIDEANSLKDKLSKESKNLDDTINAIQNKLNENN